MVESDPLTFVVTAISALPTDYDGLLAFAKAAAARADEAEAKLANVLARESARDALIAHLKLQIAKPKREQYGASAERTRRLLDQLELQLEELEADASEDALVAEAVAEKTATVRSFERKAPARKPFPRSSATRARSGALAVFVPGLRRRKVVEAG